MTPPRWSTAELACSRAADTHRSYQRGTDTRPLGAYALQASPLEGRSV